MKTDIKQLKTSTPVKSTTGVSHNKANGNRSDKNTMTKMIHVEHETKGTKGKQPSIKPAVASDDEYDDDDDDEEEEDIDDEEDEDEVDYDDENDDAEENEDDEDDEEDEEDKPSVETKNGSTSNILSKTTESVEEPSKTFAELGVVESLCEACHKMGFKKPTKIQQQSIPTALQGRDIIGLAETGSGKTAAFALPILQALLEKPQPYFALVLAPTRELAFQISEQFEALGSSIGVRTVVVVGGMDMTSQAIALQKRPHVIIATPGRIVDHLENTKGFSLRTLKYLVMDEADRMLSMDFEVPIGKILEAIPKERHTYLFSATMTSKVAKLQRASLRNPVKVEVSTKYSTVGTLVQNYLFIPSRYRDCYLAFILNEMAGNSTIIFTMTCANAQRLSIMLRSLGFPAIPLHGQLSQPKRLGALNKFKEQSRSILVATDVASRGLDIPHVDLVINYDIPTHSKDYIHRVGRTARAGRSGRAITFVTQYDVELFQRIEELIGKKMEQYETEEQEVLLLLERVTEAQRLSIMEMKTTPDMRKKRNFDDDAEDGNNARKPGTHLHKKGRTEPNRGGNKGGRGRR